jgi:hypothetical protein
VASAPLGSGGWFFFFFQKKPLLEEPAASPPIQRAGICGYPRGYPPTLAGICQRMRMCVSAEIVSGYPDSMRPSLELFPAFLIHVEITLS